MSGNDYYDNDLFERSRKKIVMELEKEFAKVLEDEIRFKTSKCLNGGCPNPEGRYLKIKSNQKYCSNYCRLAAWRKSKKGE